MAFGGEAIARHEGKAIFVPLAMPGDEAEIEIVEDRGRFARGRLVELIRPAPERVIPRCKHFGVCGGCHWQHVDYAQQLTYKTQIVGEQLQRIGGLRDPLVHPTIGPDEPWHYRNHTQFHLTRDGRLGYMALRSHDVIPIEECHILEPPVEQLWRELDVELPDLDEVALRAGVHTGEQMVVFQLKSDEAPQAEIDLPVNAVAALADGSEHVLSGDPYFHERLNGHVYQVSATSFFQVNTRMAERLVTLVVETSQFTVSTRVLDAYCGVGTFALALAPHVARVVGIEYAPDAVRDARVNAQAFANVEMLEGTVEAVLPGLREQFDVVVLDPPREGCAPAVSNAIVARGIPRVVYVSCDPSTLARDVKRLSAAGYQFVDAQPLDMFPQTFHIETVATLVSQG
jgi:23S rRNA (uracil1939-C5)-methyltransferase